jgi:hypothetical protein
LMTVKHDGEEKMRLACRMTKVRIQTQTYNIKVFYSPTDAQVNCLKSNFKIYIKIYIKTVPTCFGAITIIRERIVRSC